MKLSLKVPPLAVSVLVMAGMWLLAKITPGSDMAFGRELATGLLTGGFVVIGIAMFSMRKFETTVDPLNPDKASSLITTGIFGVSRNPIYVGMMMFILGFGFNLSNVFSLAFSAAFVLYMNRFQIIPEEDALEGLFPEEYPEYTHKVRRWI